MFESNGFIVIGVLLTVVGTLHAQNESARANVCTGHVHNALVRNTQDCGSFYHCFNGAPILSSCPTNQLFNHLTNRCDRAENVECFKCPADQVFIDLPVANECQQFVRCFNNQTEQLTCAQGLAFDRRLQMCNHQLNVTCPFEVLCPREHDNLIFTRDRDNCAKFYVCLGGVGTPRTCPETLYFNPLTNQCDHPQNTDCPKINDWLNDDPVKETFKCQETGGPLFPHATNCQKFYTCSEETGLALTHTCPNNGFFDYKYMFCGQRADVVCFTVQEISDQSAGSKLLLN